MKYDLKSLNLSKDYYSNTERLKSELDNFLKLEDIKLNNTIDQTSEAIVFLHNNFDQLVLINKKHKYFQKRKCILNKLTYLYDEADKEVLGKELNKLKYYTFKRVVWSIFIFFIIVSFIGQKLIFADTFNSDYPIVFSIEFSLAISMFITLITSAYLYDRHYE